MNARLKTEIGIGDILGHLILWLIIIIVTLGIGLFFFPYAFANFTIKRVYIIGPQGETLGRLQPDLDIPSQLGHIVLWFIISIITLGLGYFFYLYKVWNIALSRTKVVPM